MLLDGTAARSPGTEQLPPLANFVRGNMGSLAAGVLAAQSTAEALAHRSRLQPAESIVTRDGLWLGADWVRLDKTACAAEQDESAPPFGAIRGAKELASRRAAADAAEVRLHEHEHQLAETRQREIALAGEREALRSRHAEASAALADLRTRHELQRAQAQAAAQRAQRIATERTDVDAQLARETKQLQTARAQLAELQARSGALRDEEQQLRRARERDLDELTEARRQARASNETYQQSRQESATLQANLDATATTRDRSLEQSKAFESQAERALTAIARLEAELPAKEASHQTKLGEVHALEAVLRNLQIRLQDINAEIEELSNQRMHTDHAIDTVRTKRDDARLEHERLATKRDSERSQFSAVGISEQDARNGLPTDATEQQWLEKLARISRRMDRLGPINLAAIDEYETELECKQYRDRQMEDLETTLATLRNAIERIDRDTRQKFKATFEQLNENLKALFPKIFGGGRAALVLTSENWLETGVTLTAQPPGKRNVNIQMLSGGEKAMTAVALIFSIFQLNPSPVCLLDEVDAPLDDSNVQRFADLLREMSSDVQFVVITHNKQTIEMADHLLGVTMQEAGISRLVSVDVDQAARMAAAG